MSRKRNSIIDELITGVIGLLLVTSLFAIVEIFLMVTYGATAKRWSNLFSFFPILAILLVILAVCLAVKEYKQNGSNPSADIQGASRGSYSYKNDAVATISRFPLGNNVDAEAIQKYRYRKLYNVPEDVRLYRHVGVLSTYAPKTTSHEQLITELLIKSYAFSPQFIFLDNYINTNDGKTAQIDIIAVGKRGVFVVESKDYSGWIFGNGGQTQWTQTLYNKKYSKKYHFYNPIKQNTKHINALKTIIGNKPKIYSLIIFGSKATIKDISYIPKDTYVLTTRRLRELLADLRNEPECLSAEEVLEICRKIQKSRIIPDEKLRQTHNDDIKEITGENRLYS